VLRRPRRRDGRRGGVAGERLAELHYRLRGYRVLERNAWAGGNELDLVLRRGRALVFCEVKRKRGSGHGDPLEMVGREKRRRVLRAAEAWLAAHPEAAGLEPRFEVAAVRGRRVTRVVATAE
jgi:putative endonuclease